MALPIAIDRLPQPETGPEATPTPYTVIDGLIGRARELAAHILAQYGVNKPEARDKAAAMQYFRFEQVGGRGQAEHHLEVWPEQLLEDIVYDVKIDGSTEPPIVVYRSSVDPRLSQQVEPFLLGEDFELAIEGGELVPILRSSV